MSIKGLNRKILGSLVVYWLLVVLLGYFLLSSGGVGFGGGTGNGTGGGTGNGGAGGAEGTGMTAEEDAEGKGSGEEEGVFAGGEPDSKTQEENPSLADSAGQDGNSAATESANAEESSEEVASDGGDAGLKAAWQELKKAQERSSPELYGDGLQENDAGESPQSKVIGLDEAQKGFFGVEASGRSTTLFLLDISGSMDSSTAERLTRLEMLKKILINELNRLQNMAARSELKTQVGSFVLATFSDGLQVYPNNGVFSYGSMADMTMAKQIVASFQTQGSTGMMNAWQHLAPRLARGNWCNVVFFLSDGEPTDCQEPQLVGFLQNQLRTLPINTFSFGTHSSLMENIAKTHGGKYREIR